MGSGLKIRNPPPQAVGPQAVMAAHGACPVNQEAAQIRISVLTDSPQSGAAPSGVLSGDEADPRREIASLGKCRAVANGGHQCSRGERADPRHLREPLTQLVVRGDGLDLEIGLMNRPVQLA